MALDGFVVPTLTNTILFVLVSLAHQRRRIVHVNVTAHPTAAWTVPQVVEAFPRDEAPRCLWRDRDSIYSAKFRQRVRNMGSEAVRIAPPSPWQHPYVERLIGSIRRDLLAHVIVFNERHLRRLLTASVKYSHRFRPHLSLAMDGPESRAVQAPERGEVIEVAEVSRLQHHYAWQAA